MLLCAFNRLRGLNHDPTYTIYPQLFNPACQRSVNTDLQSSLSVSIKEARRKNHMHNMAYFHFCFTCTSVLISSLNFFMFFIFISDVRQHHGTWWSSTAALWSHTGTYGTEKEPQSHLLIQPLQRWITPFTLCKIVSRNYSALCFRITLMKIFEIMCSFTQFTHHKCQTNNSLFQDFKKRNAERKTKTAKEQFCDKNNTRLWVQYTNYPQISSIIH